MALQLSWAVLVVGFGFGLLGRGPASIRLRLARAAILGVVVAVGLLLGGTVIGFVEPPTDALAAATNGGILAGLFAVGALGGEEIKLRARDRRT